jgi:hypothetical protein
MHADQNTTALPSSQNDRVSAAWQQLNLVLGFFSRIDTKLSVVLGINLGMLALLATRMPALKDLTPLAAASGIAFAIALCFSFRHLWIGSFPHLEGGTNSLVYFRSIAQMKESEFRIAYGSLSSDELANDLLNQCWRNSKILTCKFHSLRYSYIATLCAVIPWMMLIVILTNLSPR